MCTLRLALLRSPQSNCVRGRTGADDRFFFRLFDDYTVVYTCTIERSTHIGWRLKVGICEKPPLGREGGKRRKREKKTLSVAFFRGVKKKKKKDRAVYFRTPCKRRPNRLLTRPGKGWRARPTDDGPEIDNWVTSARATTAAAAASSAAYERRPCFYSPAGDRTDDENKKTKKSAKIKGAVRRS